MPFHYAIRSYLSIRVLVLTAGGKPMEEVLTHYTPLAYGGPHCWRN